MTNDRDLPLLQAERARRANAHTMRLHGHTLRTTATVSIRGQPKGSKLQLDTGSVDHRDPLTMASTILGVQQARRNPLHRHRQHSRVHQHPPGKCTQMCSSTTWIGSFSGHRLPLPLQHKLVPTATQGVLCPHLGVLHTPQMDKPRIKTTSTGKSQARQRDITDLHHQSTSHHGPQQAQICSYFPMTLLNSTISSSMGQTSSPCLRRGSRRGQGMEA